ncbi:KdsC family phosphatase [Luteimonas aquatica]|uniref:KdsC family phosphatase n=1 Tax=Luteimonas aquatica TaxID=450364 RepID=UPI001F590900|nr:HAD hydrolase family protein [Luteimonas aquatica]
MPSHPPYSDDLLARAARIRLACFDVDGTLTDGRLYYDGEGRELKAFHVQDGQGLVLLRKAGVAVAFVTARRGAAAERRAAELGAEAHVGVQDKQACVEEIRARLGLSSDQVCFMGDDLPDRVPMQAAGLAVAPANAHASALAVAHWCTAARGGEGAARELCDLLLAARRRDAGVPA